MRPGRSFTLRNGDLLARGIEAWEVIDPRFDEDDLSGEYLVGYWLRHNADPKNTCVFFELHELDIMLGDGWAIVTA